MKSDILNRIVSRVMVEKKKVMIALCLVVIMIIMWLRAFSGKIPVTAEAVALSHQTSTSQSNEETDVSFIDLPYVEGRNDVLSRDFFTAVAGIAPLKSDDTTVSSNGNEAHVKWLIDDLKLEAIGMGKIPQAFINGKVYSIGDQLVLEENSDIYKFEIANIEEKSVFIKCGQTKVELKLTE